MAELKLCRYCVRPILKKKCDNCGQVEQSSSNVMTNYNAPVQYNYYNENVVDEYVEDEDIETYAEELLAKERLNYAQPKPHFTEVLTGLGISLLAFGAAATVCGFAAFIGVVVYKIAVG